MRIIQLIMLSLSLFSVGAFADDDYIPWTFEDSNQNEELIEPAKEYTEKELKIEYGELGW
ncbi:MAG: hypothetical protein GY694_10210 [Gammaproteobacteria bacterium]|nr:hypothetical protein [Gammaproteobacteria bacterium]